jgi:hypothetical protein
MTDADAVLWQYLRWQGALRAVVGERVYVATELPAGTTQAQLPLVLATARGGGQNYSSTLLRSAYQVQAFGRNEGEARLVGRLVYDVLNDAHAGQIRWARLEQGPTLLREPQTRWPFALAFYQLAVANG